MTTIDTHPAIVPAAELLESCELRFLRRSGPGGQNRNKVATAVRVTHRPSGITAEANEWRTQFENRRVALFRLRVNLALAVRCDPGSSPTPSALWAQRCRTGRIAINPEHGDFPALLAESLDVVAALGWDVKQAASALGCTASQLTRFWKREPRALALVNQHRAELGQAELR